jgi:hypothetical protein
MAAGASASGSRRRPAYLKMQLSGEDTRSSADSEGGLPCRNFGHGLLQSLRTGGKVQEVEE